MKTTKKWELLRYNLVIRLKIMTEREPIMIPDYLNAKESLDLNHCYTKKKNT